MKEIRVDGWHIAASVGDSEGLCLHVTRIDGKEPFIKSVTQIPKATVEVNFEHTNAFFQLNFFLILANRL